jgi:acetylornithine deacetylase/succinyl-diaminopimelate desuccinylase-like protein
MPTLLRREALRRYADEARPSYESCLREWVEVASVSMDPARKGDVARMAELGAGTLARFGAEVRVLETAGNPLVHGRFEAGPDLPRVTVYNHLDVQPADEPEWKGDPFRLAAEDGVYRGRGTTDDKGPALAALFGARAAREAGVRANIDFLWELEEEIGSPSFEDAIRREAAPLATDSVVVSDTVWVARGRPACPAGLRGLITFVLRLETGTTDQHSGTAGGAARNPLGELMQVVADLYDPRTGRVKVPGFYDAVRKPAREELEMFRRCGFSVRRFQLDHGFRSLRTRDPVDLMTRIWASPTLEVHGMAGGYQGAGVKTVIPPRGEVKLSCRLVPDQKPAEVLRKIRAYVRRRNPDVAVVPGGSLAPYRGVTSGPLAEAVAAAMEFGFGRRPVFVREGGSIGAVVSMERVLKAPVVFLGLSLPEHGYHAPNESFDWEQASGGIASFARYFEEVAALGRRRAGKGTRRARASA